MTVADLLLELRHADPKAKVAIRIADKMFREDIDRVDNYGSRVVIIAEKK